MSVSDIRQDPVWSYIKFLRKELGILPTVKTPNQMKSEFWNVFKAVLDHQTPQPNLTEEEKVIAELDRRLLYTYLKANDAVAECTDPTTHAYYSILKALVDCQPHSWKEIVERPWKQIMEGSWVGSEWAKNRKTIDRRLSDLVNLGLVKKRTVPAFPPRTEYTAAFSSEEAEYLTKGDELKAAREQLVFIIATKALLAAWTGKSAETVEALRELVNARNQILSSISLETVQLASQEKPNLEKKERVRLMALRVFKSIEALYFYWLPLSLLRLPELRDQAKELLESEIRSLSEEDEVKLAISSLRIA
jgi:hypothetical protein